MKRVEKEELCPEGERNRRVTRGARNWGLKLGENLGLEWLRRGSPFFEDTV